MVAIWDDPGVLWNDGSWTWDGLFVGPLVGPCDRTPDDMSAVGTLTTILSCPAYPGNMALVLAVETFAVPAALSVNVYPHRSIDSCPPDSGAALAGWDVDLPPGVVLEIDGAREEVRLVDKARKQWRNGFETLTPDRGVHRWPTFGGPCRQVCVVFDGAPADVQARVYGVVRET